MIWMVLVGMLVKGHEGDDGSSILLCGRGYRQHPRLGEQMSAGRLITHLVRHFA